MAPSIDALYSMVQPDEIQPNKKRKTSAFAAHHQDDVAWNTDPKVLTACAETIPRESSVGADVERDLAHALVPHPLGVKPLGNASESEANIRTYAGHFAWLPDEVIVHLLEYLSAAGLVKLGATCRALYAYCQLEEIWKGVYLQSPPLSIVPWKGSWRATVLKRAAKDLTSISCRGLFSDVLHRPWQCAHLSMHDYAARIPESNSISRVPHMSSHDFVSMCRQPFILTSPVTRWAIYQDWDLKRLLMKYGLRVFRAEAVDWTLATYVDYMQNNQDESPLYLFDPEFADKMDLKLAINTESAYTPIKAFEPDYFDILGEHRPNHRWLIIGPKGSGSTFHADPNGTSAWNAVIRGSKYWLMFPPPADGKAPAIPGVHISEDLSEVTTPLSLAEYLLTFHEYARQTPGCIEAICKQGEVLYVPAGWYHMVVNLEEGIAVTQNFVSEAGVPAVLRFLRDRPEQVTGFKGTRDSDHEAGDGTEFELFRSRLEREHPDVHQRAMETLRNEDEKKTKKSHWEEVTIDNSASLENPGDFSFGFALDESESE